VDLGEGRSMSIKTDWAVSPLRRNPPNLRQAELRLQSLLDEVEARSRPRVEAARAQAALQREVVRLDRPRERMPWDILLDALRGPAQEVLAWLGGLLR